MTLSHTCARAMHNQDINVCLLQSYWLLEMSVHQCATTNFRCITNIFVFESVLVCSIWEQYGGFLGLASENSLVHISRFSVYFLLTHIWSYLPSPNWSLNAQRWKQMFRNTWITVLLALELRLFSVLFPYNMLIPYNITYYLWKLCVIDWMFELNRGKAFIRLDKPPPKTKQLMCCSLNDGYFYSNFVNMSDFSYLVARFSHRIHKLLVFSSLVTSQ